MEKKKGFSILKFFIILACIILIALSLSVNILFNRKNTPDVFGYYIYLLNNQDMGAVLPEGTALISKDADGLEINQGDIVLCHLDDSDDIIIRTVYKTSVDEETGIESYYLSTAYAQDDNSVTDSIARENIVALCTGYPQNINIGRWINFTLNVKGIVLQLILPSVILVILLIAKIASSKDNEDEDDEEDFDFSEQEDKTKDTKESPLFVDPTPESYASDELERKKQSIAEHFSHKEVNPNSPYQKEKERTMQFKALKATEKTLQQNSVNKNQVDVTEMFKAPKNSSDTAQLNSEYSRPVSPLTAETLREEMQKRTAEAESSPTISEQPVTKPVTPTVSETPKKSSSPNIDDILQKSETKSRKKDVNAMSVDDLLRMIEEEKKKL